MIKKLIELKYQEGTPMADHLKAFQGLLNKLSDMGIKFKDEIHGLWLLGTLPDSWEDTSWVVDSGATTHATSQRDLFTTYSVKMGNDAIAKVAGIGDICLETSTGTRLLLKGVKHVPDIRLNLISTGKLDDEGFYSLFGGGKWKLTRGSMVMARGDKHSFFYWMQAKVSKDIVNVVENDDAIELWHKRLGHMSEKGLSVLSKKEAIPGISGLHLQKCAYCFAGKQHRVSFTSSSPSRKPDILDLVHSDVCSPLKTKSLGGASYFVTFIDDHSRKLWVYTMKTKDYVLGYFKHFVALVERQTGKKLKCIRSDNGGEYSGPFDAYCREHGIRHQKTPPKTPQLKRLAERMNKTIVERIRCLISESGLAQTFWGEALSSVVHLLNFSPSAPLEGDIPERVWTGKDVSYSHLRVCGCKAFVHIPKDERSKLEMKSRQCVFIGYGLVEFGYRFYDPVTKKLIRSRDVVFMEDQTIKDIDKSGKPAQRYECLIDSEVVPSTSVHGQVESEVHVDTPSADAPAHDESIGDHGDDHGETPTTENPPIVRRSQRGLIPSTRYDPSEYMLLTDGGEPESFGEALECEHKDKWLNAMGDEMESFDENDTFELVKLPKGKKVLLNKWVYKIKHEENILLPRYKARLVVKGFSQKKGINYDEIFSPVVKMSSIRVVLGLAASLDLEVEQMNVKTAFLHGDLEEEIYMVQPEGFEKKGKKDLVCRLKKSLYGLKQAPRQWYMKFKISCPQEMSYDHFGLIKFLTLLISFYMATSVSASDEAKALVIWKSSFKNQKLTTPLSSWTNTNTNSLCTSWFGVSCNSQGSIVRLNLTNTGIETHLQNFPFASLSNLTFLDLSINNLSGPIPLQFGQLSKLNYLNMSRNNITGPIPATIGNLKDLRFLNLQQNSLTGSIPPELGDLVSMVDLRLNQNKLTGPIPDSFGNLTNLEFLYLRRNNLSGQIPPSIAYPLKLQVMQLDTNNLTGFLPEGICGGGKLQNLTLRGNQLHGPIPKSLRKCKSLFRVRFEGNRFTGDISKVFGVYPHLNYIDLSHNKFHGEISGNWGESRKLGALIFSDNQITGTIPREIWNMTQLNLLDLSSNNVTGELPEDIRNLKRLVKLQLNGNQLTGRIPSGLGSLTDLEYLDLSSNRFASTIPTSLAFLSNLHHMNMSRNTLDKAIPIELTKLGQLSVLDLSENQLDGVIPEQISSMQSLETLDLSYNNLSGLIPTSFEDMQALTNINISHNNFEGPIPHSLVFQNAPEETLEGNKRLCGNNTKQGLKPCSSSYFGNKRFSKVVVLCVLIPILICILVATYLRRRKRLFREPTDSETGPRLFISKLSANISHHEIINATESFDAKYLIGAGGSGTVYKATVQSMVLAVKKLHETMDDERATFIVQHGFLNEINTLAEIRHRNIVKFLGYCCHSLHCFLD
ncbi:hypothetical protein AALP_AA6G199700 [Arabis alpina]|uniref:non-specific serine/threonine protein kinase n=1 Tax=Arabis alpina TaxID=50452 RepID=A0A087GQF6_ARAAL|nr:hypothetical protein AALP_AA6G199700 [Arabis alpina]